MEAIWLYQFRIILVGDSTVGKSSLLRRFTEGRFVQVSDPTVGVDFFSRLLELEPGKRVKLQLWDTAGQERFRSITQSYYRSSVGGILVFDVTSRATFESCPRWLAEARMHGQPGRPLLLLLGHKADKAEERQVSRQEAEAYATAQGLPYAEASALSGQGVEEAFTCLAKEVYGAVKAGLVPAGGEGSGVTCGIVPSTVHSSEEARAGLRPCAC
uniref:ras-related protein Rab-39B-like n=1 Tax=Myxine glutinosa TaxID=7769 RepID=UPI00358F52C0